jgi:hypothetical protein
MLRSILRSRKSCIPALAVLMALWVLTGTAAFSQVPCIFGKSGTYPCSIAGTLIVVSQPTGGLFGGGGGGGGGSRSFINDPQNPGYEQTIAPPLQASGPATLALGGTLNLATVSGQPTIKGGRASFTCGVTGTATLSMTVSTPGGSVVLQCPTLAAPGNTMTVTG